MRKQWPAFMCPSSRSGVTVCRMLAEWTLETPSPRPYKKYAEIRSAAAADLPPARGIRRGAALARFAPIRIGRRRPRSTQTPARSCLVRSRIALRPGVSALHLAHQREVVALGVLEERHP